MHSLRDYFLVFACETIPGLWDPLWPENDWGVGEYHHVRLAAHVLHPDVYHCFATVALSVSVVALPTSVSVAAGIVSVLVPDACCNEAMTGVVKVLFVSVSVVALPTTVSVAFGRVNVLAPPDAADVIVVTVSGSAAPKSTLR